VPAFLGLGAPAWDFGARATVLGISRGAGKDALVRAVLEGVAQRGADLVEAAEKDSGMRIERVRVDGGMTSNSVFVQALADACARPVEVSAEREATALGAGYLAGLAIGTWRDEDDVAAAWSPAAVVEPAGPPRRERWAEAIGRAKTWLADLSAVQF
ncbi:MAG: FGGY-family carbohydrate kinase, partial [Acidimicrobiales bacterium]